MATYEPDAVMSALRSKARDHLLELEMVVRQMLVGLDPPERIEVSTPISELRRVLAGDVPPEALSTPPNVRVLRAVGPFFKRRDLVEHDDGPGGAA